MSGVTRIPRVLIADDDKNFSRRLAEFLKERGFSCRTVHTGFDAEAIIEEWQPLFIIYDMMLPEVNAIGMLEKIRQNKFKLPSNMAFMVTSGHNVSVNVRACINAGAADFLVKPCTFEEILSRLVFQSQKRQSEESESAPSKKERGEYYLHITEILMRKATGAETNLDDVIFDLVKMQEMAMKAVRCSLIEADSQTKKGKVMASSDDKTFKNFPIDLQKYPEVTTVMATEKPVAIESLKQNSTMTKILGELKSIQFNSMIVCPVWVGSKVYGVISTRLGDGSAAITDADVRFAQILAHAMGLLIEKKALLLEKGAKPAA